MATENLSLQDAARAFISALKNIPLTKGDTRNRIEQSKKFKTLTGAGPAIYAIADYIDSNQEGTYIDANKTLLERLTGSSNIISIISDIAMAKPEELLQKEKLLRSALQMKKRGGESDDLMEAMKRAIKNIVIDTYPVLIIFLATLELRVFSPPIF